jgi:hypothetical protein
MVDVDVKVLNLPRISIYGNGWFAPLVELDRKMLTVFGASKFSYVSGSTGYDAVGDSPIFIKTEPAGDVVSGVVMAGRVQAGELGVEDIVSPYTELLRFVCSDSGSFVWDEYSANNIRSRLYPEWDGYDAELPREVIVFDSVADVERVFDFYHSVCAFSDYGVDRPVLGWLGFYEALGLLGLTPYVSVVGQTDVSFFGDDKGDLFGYSQFVPKARTSLLLKVVVDVRNNGFLKFRVHEGVFGSEVNGPSCFVGLFPDYRSILLSLRSRYVKAFRFAEANGIVVSNRNVAFLLAETSFLDGRDPDVVLGSVMAFLKGELGLSEGMFRDFAGRGLSLDDMMVFRDLPQDVVDLLFINGGM